jgi:hypothetical protein
MLTGKKRVLTDKFYTNSTAVDICFELFESHIDNNTLLVEPSAGNGAFMEKLKPYSFVAFDIEPEYPNIIKQDFLTVNLDDFNKPLAFIGNPPFGRQSSLAKKFIKHITKCPHTTTVGFILSKSFKKESMQKCFPLHYHLINQIDLPENSFNISGKTHNVPCVFQIWKKQENNRAIIPYPLSRFVDFVKKDENPDLSIRRVGVYAGKIDTDVDKSIQSHYFIKMKNNIDPLLFSIKYKSIEFEHNNTAGPKSISKKELIIALNKLSL